MEETIKVQEEFEHLIEQLERLKNINDLTTANTQNAKKVISEIDSFVKGVSEFKRRLEDDLNLKSKTIEKLITNLDNSISKIETESKELSKNLGSLFNDYKGETTANLNVVSKEVKNISDALNKTLEDWTLEIISNVEESKKAVLSNHNNLQTSLAGTISEKFSLLSEQLEKQEKEVKTVKVLLVFICVLLAVTTFVLFKMVFK